MITSARTAQCAPGKHAEGVKFAKEIAAHLKAKHGLELEVKEQIAGPVGRISWIGHFKSLADYEDTLNKFREDPDYHQILLKATGLFNPGHTHDTLWRSL